MYNYNPEELPHKCVLNWYKNKTSDKTIIEFDLLKLQSQMSGKPLYSNAYSSRTWWFDHDTSFL